MKLFFYRQRKKKGNVFLFGDHQIVECRQSCECEFLHLVKEMDRHK